MPGFSIGRPGGWRFSFVAAGALGCQSSTILAAWAGEGRDRPRVVSLHDVTTEIVVALGASDRLVGVAGPVQLPEAVKAKVRGVREVGGAESILAVRPTVVLGMAVVAERSPDLVAFLQGRGVEVWLGQPRTLDDVLALVTEVGARVGFATAARELKARVAGRIGDPPPSTTAQRKRVFVYDCCDPAFTAGQGAVLTDLIRRAGGRNIFDDVAASWTKVSWEEVIARRPQLVVIHDYEYEGQGGVVEKRKRIAAVRALTGVPVTVIPLGWSLGGLRSVEGLEHLRKVIGEVNSKADRKKGRPG